MKLAYTAILFFILIYGGVDKLGLNEALAVGSPRWEYHLASRSENRCPQTKAVRWQPFTPDTYIKNSNSHDYVWVRFPMPSKLVPHPVVYTEAGAFPYQICFKGRSIFINGRMRGGYNVPPHIYKTIPIDEDYRSASLYIKIYNAKYKVFVGRDIAKILPNDEVFHNAVRRRLPFLLISFVYLLVGLTLVVLFLFKVNQRIYFYLGSFLIGLSIYTCTYNEAFCLLLQGSHAGWIWAYNFSCYASVAAFSFYLSEVFFNHRKFFSMIGYLFLGGALIEMSFRFFKPSIAAFVCRHIYNAALVLTVLILLYLTIRSAFKGDRETRTEARIITVGFGCITISVIIAVLIASAESVEGLSFLAPVFASVPLEKGDYMSIGSFLFVSCLVFIVGRRFALLHADLEIKNRELIRLDMMKDEFLANTSHELKTPLTGMIGIAESLIDGIAGEIESAVKKNLRMIVLSGKRLSTLINDILDYVKLRNQNLKLNYSSVALKPLAEIVIAVLEHFRQGKRLTLLNTIPDDTPLVRGDENRIQQIFYNLIGNAVKFSEEGEISVSAKTVDDIVEISVSDSGIGIPPAMLERIFHPFEQVDGTISRSFGGTGLGLSITRQLVELHGGRIWVNSEKRQGTTFYFSLPVASPRDVAEINQAPLEHQKSERLPFPEPLFDTCDVTPVMPLNLGEKTAAVEKAQLPPAISLGMPRILVADDEKVNLYVLRNQLSLQNYQVTTAQNGLEVLELVENQAPFDLLILDIMMPKLSGYRVCRELRKKFSMFELPILMLTVRNRTEDLIAGFQAGANDYLVKPFDKAELLARVTTLSSFKQAIDASLATARRLESEKKQRMISERLQKLIKNLTSTLELKDIMQQLLDAIHESIPFQRSIFLEYVDKGFKVIYSSWDNLEQLKEITSHSILKQIANQRQIYKISPREIRAAKVCGSLLGIPIVYKDNVSGVILLDTGSGNGLGSQDIDLISTYTAHAGVIIENARLFKKVMTLATLDGLTNLYNRRHFFELAEREFIGAKRYHRALSLIIFDIDNFKRINDALGHIVGDQILRQVSKRVRHEVKRKVDIIGRYGGEEFAVLLPETSLKSAVRLAEALRKAIETESFPVPDLGEQHVTISLGVAEINSTTSDFEELLKLADDALYVAKRSGRNCVKIIANENTALQTIQATEGQS